MMINILFAIIAISFGRTQYIMKDNQNSKCNLLTSVVGKNFTTKYKIMSDSYRSKDRIQGLGHYEFKYPINFTNKATGDVTVKGAGYVVTEYDTSYLGGANLINGDYNTGMQLQVLFIDHGGHLGPFVSVFN